MTMFRFREHRIVAFSGGRFLIHGTTEPKSNSINASTIWLNIRE